MSQQIKLQNFKAQKGRNEQLTKRINFEKIHEIAEREELDD